MLYRFAVVLTLLFSIIGTAAKAQSCYSTYIREPSPFLGNGGEYITLGDGSLWKVMDYQYLYLYEYLPNVSICPGTGKLLLNSFSRSYSFNVMAYGPIAAVGATNDGIYQWSPSEYLSIHQDGSTIIGTIYFNIDGNFSFAATAGAGVLPVPQIDVFDLLGGTASGSTAKMSGTRFHRACSVVYNFTFNSNSTITVSRVSAANTAAATAAGLSCTAIAALETSPRIVPKIQFR
jgi:hypothetical protein